jgi:hypothetical protein
MKNVRNVLTRRLVPALTAGALLVTALTACSDSAEPAAAPDLEAAPASGGIWAGNVTVEPTAAGLRVGNNTERPIGYVAFARDILPVITWRPCEQPTGCPTIIQGERRTIAPADIPGLQNGKGDVVFYWWHLVQGRDGKLQADSIREVSAKL